MKRNGVPAVFDKLIPYVLLPAVIGVFTGVLIFIFKVSSGYVMDLSVGIYSFVRQEPRYIPLLILGVAAVGLFSALILRLAKECRGGGIPTAIASIRGLIPIKWVQGIFALLGIKMGASNLINTIMNTAHDLLINTVFYLMAICVITGAIGKLFTEFGVVELFEAILRPLMKPLFNLPGMASLGGVLAFLSDNPAVIGLAKDKRFASHFKKFQLISLTNFGTAFG